MEQADQVINIKLLKFFLRIKKIKLKKYIRKLNNIKKSKKYIKSFILE